MIFHCRSLIAGHKISPVSSPFCVYVYRRLQHLSKLHTGSKLVVMSQNSACTVKKNIPPSAGEYENSLQKSTTAHTSFCTVQLKHKSEVTISKTYFGLDGDI